MTRSEIITNANNAHKANNAAVKAGTITLLQWTKNVDKIYNNFIAAMRSINVSDHTASLIYSRRIVHDNNFI